MKVKLLRAARIRHEAGEVVEASPAEAGFLLSVGSAVRVAEAPERENPEQQAAKAETPERAAAKKSTRAKK